MTTELVSIPKALPVNPAERGHRKWPKTIGPKWITNVMPWVETFWFEHKRHPTESEFMLEFGFNLDQHRELTNHILYKRACERRGIRLPSAPVGWLSDRQVAAVAILTNFNDTRPALAKLAMLGVKEDELNGWYQDPEFKRQLSLRADTVLDDVAPDAQVELARAIKKGNFQAIKFYYEITGRAQSPEAVNVKQAMQIIIEAVQKHVQDPEVLRAIADEVQTKRAIQGL